MVDIGVESRGPLPAATVGTEMPAEPHDSRTIAVVIVAAGSGSRAAAASGLPKQYCRIGGRAVIERTLEAFLTHPAISMVQPVIHADYTETYRSATEHLQKRFPALLAPVAGGGTRQSSVRAGLEALQPTAPDYVLIHDAARPFVSHDIISRAIAALERSPAALVAVPVVDTPKRAGPDGVVTETLARDGLWAAQTPQAFHYAAIASAHEAADAAGRTDFTDDSAVAEWSGIPVSVVLGDAGNSKITTAADLAAADQRIRMRDMLQLQDIRVGTGYDVHSFEPGDHVTLAGVRIDHTARLNGHSDADVALHALTDAILGAIGDGDIGQHFPPSDMRWRGADSAIFLRDALARVTERGGIVAHVDISIIAEAPRIGPHREAMRARVADILGLALDRVGVKATTNERLGFVGRREGIAAIATATIRLPFPSDESLPR